MLKPFLLLFAVVLFAITPTSTPTLAAGGSPQATPTASQARATAASLEKAKKLYAMDCALCHGETGNGKTDLATSMNVVLADWTDPKILAPLSDQQLFDIIRKGKGDKMPAEDAGRAKNDEVNALIAYIRTFSKNQPAAPAAPDAAPAAPAAPTAAAPGK